jgi:hypothetical protein
MRVGRRVLFERSFDLGEIGNDRGAHFAFPLNQGQHGVLVTESAARLRPARLAANEGLIRFDNGAVLA